LRIFSIAALALALAAPAAAQNGSYHHALPSPAEAEAVGRVVGSTADALLDVDVGPVIDAVDPGRHYRSRERTIGDLASRDDPYYRERMHRSIGAVSVGLGDMATRAAILAPALRRSLHDLERSIEQATRDLPRRERYDDYDPYWDD
jgi:hypothetical protein